MKNNVSTFAKMKANGEKISMLTAYDYSTAKIMDNCVNGILVGDSLGNVMLGYEDTLSVTVQYQEHVKMQWLLLICLLCLMKFLLNKQ